MAFVGLIRSVSIRLVSVKLIAEGSRWTGALFLLLSLERVLEFYQNFGAFSKNTLNEQYSKQNTPHCPQP